MCKDVNDMCIIRKNRTHTTYNRDDVLMEYDDHENLVHYKNNLSKYECWKEWDDQKRLVHFKENSGKEVYYGYDDNNIVRRKTTLFANGKKFIIESDEKGELLKISKVTEGGS